MKRALFILRLVLCGVVTLFNGASIALQGNGNFILSGLGIGVALGSAWSVLLLFGIPRWVRRFRPSAVSLLSGAALLLGLALIAVVSVKLWGDSFL